MPSREDISSRCVSVDNVLKELKEDLKRAVARQAGLSEGQILVEEVVGYHTEQTLARFVFLLDHKRSVDRLCEEIKVITVEKDGRRVDLTFERSTECEIAEEWTKLEAPAESAMGSTPKGPAVPPKAPHRTPRPQQMIASGVYQNFEHPSGPPFGPAPGPGPGPMPSGMRPGIPQAYLPQHFNPGSPGQGDSGMHAQNPFPHQQGQFPQMRFMPPFVMGPRGPMPLPGYAVPQMPAEGDRPHGQGDGHFQSNQEFQYMPHAFFDPRMFPMYPPGSVPQQVHDNRPHSSPPPPYNGSIPEHTDQMDNTAETSQKSAAVEEPKISELKEAIPSPRNKGDHGGINPSKAVVDQEDYMGRLHKKMEKEKDDKKGDIGPTDQELEQQHSPDGAVTDEEAGKSDQSGQDSYVVIEDDRITKILVSGLPAAIDKDYVELLFEKKGGSINSVEIDREESTAVIEFDDPDAVQIVLSKRPIKIGKVIVEVERYEPLPIEELPQCTVRVNGVPKSCSQEFLQLYFENHKKSGGDTLTEIEYNEGDEVAYLTFETEEVARNVVEREHTLSGAKLVVCLHSPVPSKSCIEQDNQQDRGPLRQQSMNEEQSTKIWVGNLPPTANEEYLSMFFENEKRKGGGPVSSVEMYEDNTAIVEFEQSEAVDIVLGKLPIAMGDHTLQIEVYNPIPQEPEPECTIEVRGPQEILKSEMLVMYFESEKYSSGGEIAEVTREENVTFVTFNSEEVARRVVKRGQHKINAKMIQVTLHHPKHQESPWQCPLSQKDAEEPADDLLWTVKVDSVSQIESMETLQLYFENKRRSGGGAVAQFEVYKEEDRAYITYEEEEVARRVVEKGPHKIEGKTVEVSLCEPLKSRTLREPKQEDEQEEPLCSIKVKGISNMKSLETLEYYFENAKRSGGGSIEKFEPHEEEDFAYVTFEAEDVARRVANRKHKLEEVDLSVSLYKPPRQRPAYGNRVIIEGVNVSTTKDCLFNFLEARSGASPTQLVYGEQEGTVMVTFETEPDFQKLVDACRKRTLEKSTLTVSEVCMSNCIIISNLKPSTSSDTVQFYFENKRRSNGGDIEKVKMLEEIGTCLVFFQDYTVVDDVLLQKHRLEGQELSVQVYIEKLGRSQGDGSEPRLKIPDAITINDIEEKIVDFIKKSDSCIEAVHKQLDGCYAKVVWPEKGSSVVVECEITVNTPDYRKLVKDWKANVEKNMKDYVKMLCLKEHPVWDEGWEAVLEGLGEISIENPDGVALFVDKKEKIIKVVGYSHSVASVSKTIEEVIEKINNDIERKKQTVKQTLSNLKPLHLRMLLASKYPVKTEEKLANLKVRINQNKNELTFEGVLADIQSAKVDMYEKISSFAIRVKENISQNCIDLYQSKPVRDFIVKKLKSGRLVGVWEATDLKLAVCSAETDLPSCLEFITDAVQEKMLSVNKASASIFTSQKWQERLKEIYNTNSGLCKVSVKEDFSKIYITATSDIIDELTGTVASFLAQHTILNETLTLGNKSIIKLIQNHHTNKLADIAKDLTHHYVQIHCDSTGISVQGTENGIRFAKEQLTRLAQQLQKKEHSLNRPGLSSHMDSEKGQDSIKSVENAFPVVIKLGSDEEDIDFRAVVSGASSQAPDLGLKLHAIGEAYDDRTIYSAEGEMSQIRVDVLVNSADNSLSLSGGLGKVLANRGGSEIIKECQDYVKKYGKLNEGDVFMSSGGDLPARFIVHVSSPQWRNGQRKETEVLKEAVFKAMQQATIRNANSIAIPALGCGNYGFPLKTATEIIVTAVKDFFREVQESEIMKVYLVDVKPMTVEAFTDAMKDAFANVHPVSKDVGHQNSDDKDEGYRQKPVPQPRHKPVSSGESSSDENGADTSMGFGNIIVEIIEGEIALEKVDIIVNTTGKNLDLRNGAVSASLLKTGGNSIQQDLSKNYPKGLGDGEIAVSVGGNLNCRHVLHGSLMNWDGGEKAIQALHKLMASCLQEADKRQATSIAFPAVGTGQLGFPRDIVAKEMFSAIGKFENKHHSSSVTEVKFVVYHKDFATVKAFKSEKKNWTGGGRKTRRSSRQSSRQSDVSYSSKRDDADDEGGVKVPSKKSDGSLSIGGITITVKQGDITESKTDCIVNSSNDDLDLSRGAVAQALLRKGGDKLRTETAAQASKMKTHQMAMTSAPGLPCQHIIHVVAQDTEADWKKVIGDCLQLADSTKIHNIAFPALGTGLQMKPKDSAKIVLTAIHSFASQSPRHLKEIIFIIYQEKMMKDFKQAVKNFNMDKPASVWSSLKGAFGGKSAPKKEHFRYEPEDPNVVTFTLYSLSMRSINDAITRLEKIIDQDLLDKVMKDSIIEKLTPDQVRELRAMANGQQIQLEVQQNKGYLKMAGISKNVMDFTDKAQKFLRGIERFELEKNHAEMLKNIVQWFYIEITETGQNLVMYTPHLNYSIEKAFKDQQPSHQFKDSEGVAYTVDFAAMEEYPVDNKEDTVKVIRRDLIKDGSVETPTTWTPMNKTENLKVVTLQPSDSEYTTVVNLFNTTSQGNYTITKVDRIQNLTLYQQYQAKKKLLDQQNTSGTQNERTLWHGTAPEAVDSINAHGFNRSYCGKNATAFGDGVYFAVSAGYSCQNTYSRPDPNGIKRMYLCKVLTGEFVMGKSGMRVPPQKPSGASAHALYDSVVNNVQNPSMFIIFNDTQAYPDYLVAFK